MKTIWDVIKAPVITEKALRVKESVSVEEGGKQVLSFIVDSSANKYSIKRAVETIMKVKVDAVRIVNGQGKVVRRGRTFGRRPDYKKAYVTLQAGQQITDYGDVI